MLDLATGLEQQVQSIAADVNVPEVIGKWLTSISEPENLHDFIMANMVEALISNLLRLNPTYYCHWLVHNGFIERTFSPAGQSLEPGDYIWRNLCGPFGMAYQYECRYLGNLY